MDGINDDVLATGNDELIGDELEGMEFDDSILFGDDDDDQEFEGQESEMAVEEESAADKSIPDVIDTTTTQGDGNPAEGNQGGEGQQQQDPNVKEIDGKLYLEVGADNAQVLSKDGKHNIPYQVLEKARQRSADADEWQSKYNELEGKYQTTSQKQKLFEQQLEDAGIDPDKLPDEVLSDPEALARIKDELPGEAGAIIEALVGRINGGTQDQGQQQAPVEPQGNQAPEGNPANDALQQECCAELAKWQTGDQDRWDMALVIDKTLQNDPAFSSLPLEQRFAEVQRRVQGAFGDPVKEGIKQELASQEQREQAAKQPPAQAQSIPSSPSEISGSSYDTTTASQQALLEKDPLALEHDMANMSDAELEELLSAAGTVL